jgi:hypothetical protein
MVKWLCLAIWDVCDPQQSDGAALVVWRLYNLRLSPGQQR